VGSRAPSASGRGAASRSPAAGSGSRPTRKSRRGREPGLREKGTALKRPGIAPEHIERLLDRQPWSRLETILRNGGVEPEGVMDRLRRFAALLIHWNRTISNLMSHNDEQRLIDRHLGESLGPLRAMRESAIDRWLDIGSGGGLPAIPLALAGVGQQWTLVESRRMKTLFLQKVKQEMRLENVQVVCARIEKLELPAPFGGVTSRATLRLAPTLAEASRFVATGGKAFLWKGERRAGEMLDDPTWRADWVEGESFELSDTRTVVVSFSKK
jgi:16S rRNA (guanine527-N7)-methyltransferase